MLSDECTEEEFQNFFNWLATPDITDEDKQSDWYDPEDYEWYDELNDGEDAAKFLELVNK